MVELGKGQVHVPPSGSAVQKGMWTPGGRTAKDANERHFCLREKIDLVGSRFLDAHLVGFGLFV